MSDPEVHPDDKLLHYLGYVGCVRDFLRMQNWDIILHREINQDHDDVLAHTWQPDTHATINIDLGHGFFDETPTRIRDCTVHELIHAMHRDVTLLWEGCTLENTDVPRAQAESWDKDFHMFQERFVSWVTRNMAYRVPEFNPLRDYGYHHGVYMEGDHRA